MRANSWLAQIKDGKVTAFAGDGVERLHGGLAEGAWHGDFTAEGFALSRFRCGSGLLVEGRKVRILGPSNNMEPVYCFVEDGQLLVSNSLQLIIAAQPLAMPTSMGKMRSAARDTARGLLEYSRELCETVSGRLLRFVFADLEIDLTDLSVAERVSLTWAAGRFKDFAGYERYLLDTIRGIVANAADRRRAQPYKELLTTCSQGYDSAACAAVASEIGCQAALTVRSARGGADDSGAPVARALGLDCLEFDRFGTGVEAAKEKGRPEVVRETEVLPEHADFLASAHTAEDLYFSTFADRLAGTVVLTGFHGDRVWAKGCPSGVACVRGDSSGTGIDEFRKRISFVNVPVPYIGARYAVDIARIAASDEMRPWSIGHSYDRPIPRRLAEERGVPRDAFGQKKAAASVLLDGYGPQRDAAFKALVAEYREALGSVRGVPIT